MSEYSVTIKFDTERLQNYTDEHLAQLWHLSQANPAPTGDKEAGLMTAHIGAEILRRWLTAQAPSLYCHREADFYWKTLADSGKWECTEDGGKRWTPSALPRLDESNGHIPF